MNDIDWKILSTLYQKKNITKASEQLFMTQSALTKRLQMIEKEWGMRLAVRGKHGIAFTPEGEFLARSAQEVLDKIQSIQSALGNISSGNSGIIRLGVNNAYGQHLLPAMMQSYISLYPNISFDVRQMLSSEIVAAVSNKELQMGIISGDFNFSGVKKLISVDTAYVISKEPLTLKQLPTTPRVARPFSPETDHLYADWWAEWFTVPPLIGMQVNQSSSCLEIVSSGYGYTVSLIPSPTLDSVHMCKLPLFHRDGSPLRRDTWAICRPEFYEVSLIRDWMLFLEESNPSKQFPGGIV